MTRTAVTAWSTTITVRSARSPTSSTTMRASPKWAVVSPGVFRAEHFLPLDNTYLSLEGNLVVPFDKRTVSRSPKAERDHVLSPITERALEQYYQLAA